MKREALTLNKIKNWIVGLLIICCMGAVGNLVGYDFGLRQSLPGMLILFAIGLVSLFVEWLIPSSLPTIAYTSIVGILVALPWFPGSNYVIQAVGNIQLMAVVTPILAYAGLIIGKDWKTFLKLGWKAVLIGILVICSTYVFSALIAEVLMRIQGVI